MKVIEEVNKDGNVEVSSWFVSNWFWFLLDFVNLLCHCNICNSRKKIKDLPRTAIPIVVSVFLKEPLIYSNYIILVNSNTANSNNNNNKSNYNNHNHNHNKNQVSVTT